MQTRRRTCVQHGDYAGDSQRRALPAPAITLADAFHTLCIGRIGEAAAIIAAPAYKMIRKLPNVYLNVIYVPNGGCSRARRLARTLRGG